DVILGGVLSSRESAEFDSPEQPEHNNPKASSLITASCVHQACHERSKNPALTRGRGLNQGQERESRRQSPPANRAIAPGAPARHHRPLNNKTATATTTPREINAP